MASVMFALVDQADVALGRLAARQHWVVSRDQAARLGLTRRQIETRVRDGLLAVVHRGVYRLAAVPRSAEQRLMAACLATGGAVSHRAACRLLKLRGVDEAPIEITVAPGVNNRLRGVVVHRARRRLQAGDVTRVGALPTTRPALSLLDLAGVAPRIIEPAVEDALFRRLVTVAQMRAVLDEWGGRGRAGSSVLRALLDARDPSQGPTESVLEDEIVSVLRRFDLPKPVRQHPLVGPRGRKLRLDVAYPDVLVDIEADGLRWHSGGPDGERDRERDNFLAARGWVVLRFTPSVIRRRPAQLATQVASVLAARGALR